jgi:hypothetical protein
VTLAGLAARWQRWCPEPRSPRPIEARCRFGVHRARERVSIKVALFRVSMRQRHAQNETGAQYGRYPSGQITRRAQNNACHGSTGCNDGFRAGDRGSPLGLGGGLVYPMRRPGCRPGSSFLETAVEQLSHGRPRLLLLWVACAPWLYLAICNSAPMHARE